MITLTLFFEIIKGVKMIKKIIKNWLGLERISIDFENTKSAHKQIIQTHRELLDKIVNFEALMCKEYIELKNKIEVLEKKMKEKE